MNRYGGNASAFLHYLLLLHFYFLLHKILLDFVGGDEENRTPDPLLARQVLSQLSYTPEFLLILCQLQLAVQEYCLRLASLSE